jgi:hypothetical protein
MALPRPIGIATNNAIIVITNVPAKIGSAPNLLPITPGDHTVPVIKYQKLLNLKNSIASNRIENKIPKVVKIEIAAALIKANLISFSLSSLCFFLDSKVLNTFAFVLNLSSILNQVDYRMVT